MNSILKSLMAVSAPAVLAGLLGAGAQIQPAIDAQPATQPATAPGVQSVARNDSPLVIPDGTTGPVSPSGLRASSARAMAGARL